jgi:hypothetical protein
MDEDDLTADLNGLSLEEHMEKEIQSELERGRTLFKEVETFAEYVQNFPSYRREKVKFQHLRRDIQTDLDRLEKVSFNRTIFIALEGRFR